MRYLSLGTIVLVAAVLAGAAYTSRRATTSSWPRPIMPTGRA
jgi:hypothetical protein